MSDLTYNYEVQRELVNGKYQTTTSSPNLQEAMQVAMHQAQVEKVQHRVVRVPILEGQTVAIFPPI
jgi:hypothetical protein